MQIVALLQGKVSAVFRRAHLRPDLPANSGRWPPPATYIGVVPIRDNFVLRPGRMESCVAVRRRQVSIGRASQFRVASWWRTLGHYYYNLLIGNCRLVDVARLRCAFVVYPLRHFENENALRRHCKPGLSTLRRAWKMRSATGQ